MRAAPWWPAERPRRSRARNVHTRVATCGAYLPCDLFVSSFGFRVWGSTPHWQRNFNSKLETRNSKLPMSEHYEEIIAGESTWRSGPGARHEQVCERLHLRVLAGLTNLSPARLLAPRTLVELAPGHLLRPDLTLVTTATDKP